MRKRGYAPVDPVDAWLGGSWMDDPDFHDGYGEIRLRREPEAPLTPSVARAERARPRTLCPECGCAVAV